MAFEISIQLGGHTTIAKVDALPRVGDLISCAFPASGISRLFLQVKSVHFNQPLIEFEGRVCPEPFTIAVVVDGDLSKKAHNDAVFAKLMGGAEDA